ncbi:MAG TPA: pentapeptide repeat-containing protein [Candidatus Elarobacter sp.]
MIDGCVGCRFPTDMHGRDLHGVRFVGSDLRGADFTRADLHDAHFVGSDLHGARFDDANLHGAEFVGANLRGASLARVDFHGSRLIAANLRDAKLTNATLGDVVLCVASDAERDDGDHTSCANLRGVDLRGLDLRAARWCSNHGATCRPVTRDELVRLAHADLDGAQAPS